MRHIILPVSVFAISCAREAVGKNERRKERRKKTDAAPNQVRHLLNECLLGRKPGGAIGTRRLGFLGGLRWASGLIWQADHKTDGYILVVAASAELVHFMGISRLHVHRKHLAQVYPRPGGKPI